MMTDTDISKTDPVDEDPECPPRDEQLPTEDQDDPVAMRETDTDDGGSWTPPPKKDPPGG